METQQMNTIRQLEKSLAEKSESLNQMAEELDNVWHDNEMNESILESRISSLQMR